MVELDKHDMDEFAAFHTQSAPVTSSDNAVARFRRQDKFLVVLFAIFTLALVGLALLAAIPLVGLTLDVLGIRFAFVQNLNAWWYDGWQGLWWMLGLSLLMLVTAVLGRYRILHNASLYYEAGCPRCQEHDLLRISRYRRDRILAAFGFPIRRYACRNCTWQGTRLAGLDPAMATQMQLGYDEEYPI